MSSTILGNATPYSPVTTLSADFNIAAVQATVTSIAAFGTAPIYVVLTAASNTGFASNDPAHYETILVEGISGNNLTTITRAIEGTEQDWVIGDLIAAFFTAEQWNIAATGIIVQSATAPTGTQEGRLWLDTTDNIYQGTVFDGLDNSSYLATANTIIRRDEAGRARVVDPSNVADIATKGYADVSGVMEKIATTTLSEAAASITFSSIPATYKHLQVVGIARTDRNTPSDNIKMRLNSDTGTNYHYQYVSFEITSTVVSQSDAANEILACAITGNTATAGNVGHLNLWIYNYAQTTFRKRVHITGGVKASDDFHYSSAVYGAWESTSAITTILLYPGTGPNFLTGTTFTLYGIK